MSGVSISADGGSVSAGLVPFDAGRHAGLGPDAVARRRYLRGLTVVRVFLDEYLVAARDYPLVFIQSTDGNVQTCVITGLRRDENLFVDADGEWVESTYVPASVRRYPFHTVPEAIATGGTTRTRVLVDESALGKSADPYFAQDGTPTDRWHQAERFLADLGTAENNTLAFCRRIAELDLLEPFDALVNPQQQDSLQVTGMSRVNEDRLNALPADTIREMMQRGELSRIYAHLISLENFGRLLDLAATADAAPG